MKGTRPSRRRVYAATTAATLSALVLTSCSSADEPASETLEERTYETVDETARLAQACTDVINERDYETFENGRDATFNVARAAITGDLPADSDVETWVEQISAVQSLLGEERDHLAEVSDEPDWTAVLDAYDATLDVLQTRLTALEDGDLEGLQDTVGEVFSSPDVEVLEALGLAGRDCEALLGLPGLPSENTDFYVAAANTCRHIVDRRRVNDLEASQVLSMEIVAAAYAEDPIPEDDGHREAVEQLAEEWELTLADLRAVGTDEVPDAAAWDELIETVEARADRYRVRAEALDSGDDDEIIEAFRPGGADAGDAFIPWDEVGLDRRDCRLLN